MAYVTKAGSAVLSVSFGSRYIQGREACTGAIEAAIAEKTGYEVRRAYMGRQMAGITDAPGGRGSDSLVSALERAAGDGITRLAVQPVFVVYGWEYRRLEAVLSGSADRGDAVMQAGIRPGAGSLYRYKNMRTVLGKPLLAEDADIAAVAAAVAGRLSVYADGRTALCMMGHGTATGENNAYLRLQQAFLQSGYTDCYTGVMKGKPGVEDILAQLKTHRAYRSVVLFPLMVTAGAHVRNEMAGSRADSWKTVMERAGYETLCLMEGLGQLPAVQEIYADHAKEALQLL